MLGEKLLGEERMPLISMTASASSASGTTRSSCGPGTGYRCRPRGL